MTSSSCTGKGTSRRRRSCGACSAERHPATSAAWSRDSRLRRLAEVHDLDDLRYLRARRGKGQRLRTDQEGGLPLCWNQHGGRFETRPVVREITYLRRFRLGRKYHNGVKLVFPRHLLGGSGTRREITAVQDRHAGPFVVYTAPCWPYRRYYTIFGPRYKSIKISESKVFEFTPLTRHEAFGILSLVFCTQSRWGYSSVGRASQWH